MSKVTAKKTKAGGNALAKIAGNYLVKKPVVLSDGTIQTERWETGIIPLDILTGGGFPKGKGVAIGSEEGVGKTTLLLHAALNIMNKYGKKVVYMDVEGGVTYDLLGSIGIDTDNHLFDPEENPDGLFMLLNVQTIQDVSRVSKAALEDPDTAMVIMTLIHK